MIFDVDKCTNCQNCVISVLDEYSENEHIGYSKPIPRSGMRLVDVKTYEQGSDKDVKVAYVPQTCNNCTNAPCLNAGKKGSVYRRKDGIIMIDPIKSKGQKDIVQSCPYGHIWWNADEDVPQLWIFDAHLLDSGWKQPRMVEACPTEAIEAIKLMPQEMSVRRERESLSILNPEYETQPNVFYKNLDSAFKWFLRGSVLSDESGMRNAVEGVEVKLFRNGTELHFTQTDFFGDFEFAGLDAETADYEVRVQLPTCGEIKADITLSSSHRMDPFVYAVSRDQG